MPAQSAHDSDELTLNEVAAELKVSIRTVERAQADGLITPIYYTSLRGKKTRRFKRADVERLQERAVAS